MYKLYYFPGSCALAAQITLEEAELPYEAILVPKDSKKLPDGRDYFRVNPLGYVPYLQFEDGSGLREAPAILEFIADQAPDKDLAPAQGTIERYRLNAWLAFISSELHKRFAPLFNPQQPQEAKDIFTQEIHHRLAWVDGELAGKQYLTGDQFTVADALLFTITNWAKPMNMDLSKYANIQSFRKNVSQRKSTQAALKAQNLI